MRARPPLSSARRRGRRSALAGLAAAIVLTSGSFAAAAPGDPGDGSGGSSGPGAGAATPADRHTVTLLTGDVVTLTDLADGSRTVDVEPADPAALVRTYVVDGHIHVVPEAALPYLASGALDDALFDVSQLVEFGFDDASVAATPIIVEYSDGPRPRTGPVTGLDLDVALTSIGGAAGGADRAVAEQAWAELTSSSGRSAAAGALSAGIETIHLDAPVEAYLDTSVGYIGAPQAWAAGFDGTGVRVAILDSGVDAGHPDLTESVIETQSFVPGETVDDVNGHGTHVASTVAGSGAASGGLYGGVAPGADLLVGKVLSDNGEGLTSWIIEGMEWGAANADVVSMSLGSREASDGTDIMSEALNEITAETGTLFIVAAGNSGAPGTIGAPAAASGSLAIGSVDDTTDELSWFSSQGPLYGSGALKPDVSAPGSGITAARSQFSAGEGSYTTMDGTSMATPHVSGAAAIALQADPTLTGVQLRDLLVSSARDLGFTPYQAGSGVIDVLAAVERDVFATGSADFGMLPWGEASGTVDRDVTFTNRSDTELTLDLALSVAVETPGGDGGGGIDPGIAPGSTTLAADDAVLLPQTQVTVPAGGTATVTLAGDHAALAPGEQLSGTLVGSVAGEALTRTSIGMITEAERYDLTLRATGIDGRPATMYAMFFNLDTQSAESIIVDGETTLRLPAGRYSAMAYADVETAPGTDAIALVGDPDIVLEGDTTVALDVRTADPVTVDVGRDDLSAENRRMDYSVEGMMGSAMIPLLVDELLAQPLVAESATSFAFTTRWRLRDPRITLTLDGADLGAREQPAAPYLDGELSTTATDLGAGSSADVAGVALDGGIAVVRSSTEVGPVERAANVAATGAALLVVVQGEESLEWYGDDFGNDAPLPVAAVSGPNGQALLGALAAGDVELSAVGRPVADDVYDVLLYTDGEIPANPTKIADDLALVTTTYHGAQNTLVGEFRYDFAPGVDVGQGFLFATERPGVRREWVSTTDAEWYQGATDIGSTWEVRDVRRSYTTGEELEASYFSPIVRPYVGAGYWAPFRQADGVQINVPGWADGGDAMRTGALDTYSGLPGLSQLGQLYVDGTLVSESAYQGVTAWDLPPGEARLRFVNTTSHDPTMIPTSTSTVTQWEFDSRAPAAFDEAILPMMQAFYDVEAAIDGTVGAGRTVGEPVPLAVEVGHLAGATGSAELASVTAEFSTDDGAAWQQLELTETPAVAGAVLPLATFVQEREYVRSFAAEIPIPDSGGTVSLRVSAQDAAGNAFSQEITSAFVVVPALDPGEPTEPPAPTEPPSSGGPSNPGDGGAGDPGAGDPTDAGPGTGSTGGSLPSTGASIGLLVLLAAAAVGGGLLLRRRFAAAHPGRP
ncbi:S8 family serine peptidase [Occultella aeris]|uniref:Subtilisin E n=1 Tax=Occultella aeris TaxID=2761496 RepID=A0A7M4DS82_9MICO|nr:S8 family serine peptidase [Occultella aeris]VZO40326.1 Subtilisin E precursor [Occultella aeris]